MRLLIVAGDTASGREALPAGVNALVDAASEIHVVTATVVSRLQWLTGGVDQARQVADERLAVILGDLDTAPASVSGSVGDPLPMSAFDDVVRDFDPDHIVIAYPRTNRSRWQDKDLIEKLLERFNVPITAFEVT